MRGIQVGGKTLNAPIAFWADQMIFAKNKEDMSYKIQELQQEYDK